MHRLWAVTRETFIEGLRTRVVIVFLVLLGVCVLATALLLEGDGTLKGRVQTFLAYSTGLEQLLLGLVTIFLTTGIVTRDIRNKTVFTVATKPLPRWQYVVGRWAGVSLLNAVLLAAANGSIYGLAEYLRGMKTQVEQNKARQLVAADAPDPDRRALESEVFTARAEHRPEPFDVSQQVEQRFDQLVQERGLDAVIRERVLRELEAEQHATARDKPLDPRRAEQLLRDQPTRDRVVGEIKAEMTEQAIAERQMVMIGSSMRLVFRDLQIPQREGEQLQLVYRLRPMHVPESRLLKSRWEVENPQTGLNLFRYQDDSAEATSSLSFPAQIRTDKGTLRLVADDGSLTVYYVNWPDPTWHTPVKVRPEEVTLLYRVGSFEGNVARATLLMLLRLMFLAAIGVLFGVFLSFPVACLVCLLVLGLGLMSGFIHDATQIGTYTGANPTGWDYFSNGLVRAIFFFLPSFSRSDPAENIMGGIAISYGDMLREMLAMFRRPGAEAAGLWKSLGFQIQTGAGLRTWVCLALGCLIFRRRELAKVQV